MLTIRKAKERGETHTDWLTSYHTFSFAEYDAEDWVDRGFIRVINEDYIQPAGGFGMHSHHDMEIITYLISGALQHHDSMGNGSIIKPGDVQRMSAGSGVRHSEFNASDKEELHLLQIWILPEKKGITPSYEQKQIPQIRNQLILIGAPEAAQQSVQIHQNIELYVGYFDQGESISYPIDQHNVWLQVMKGEISVNECILHAGDGAWIQQEESLHLTCIQNSEFLLFKSK
jgi:redox-sensitive bicupin YhaK (pirin superfamily)